MSSVRPARELSISPPQVALSMMVQSTMLLSSVVSLLSTRVLGCSTINAVYADEAEEGGQYPFIIIMVFVFCVDYWEMEKLTGKKGSKI